MQEAGYDSQDVYLAKILLLEEYKDRHQPAYAQAILEGMLAEGMQVCVLAAAFHSNHTHLLGPP